MMYKKKASLALIQLAIEQDVVLKEVLNDFLEMDKILGTSLEKLQP